MHRNLQNTSTLELPEDLSPKTIFQNLSSEHCLPSIKREEEEGAENNVVSVKPPHSFQMVSFFSTAQVTYMTKGGEARGEHFFFCKTENSRHLSSRKNACLSAGQIFKNCSQRLSLIGPPRLFTQPFPRKSTKAKVLPHLVTTDRPINHTKLQRIVFHIMQLMPRMQKTILQYKPY